MRDTLGTNNISYKIHMHIGEPYVRGGKGRQSRKEG